MLVTVYKQGTQRCWWVQDWLHLWGAWEPLPSKEMYWLVRARNELYMMETLAVHQHLEWALLVLFFDHDISEQHSDVDIIKTMPKKCCWLTMPNLCGWNCSVNLRIPGCQVEAVITNKYLYQHLSTSGVKCWELGCLCNTREVQCHILRVCQHLNVDKIYYIE